MVAKLQKQGDHYTLVLDRELVERSQLNESTPLTIKSVGGSLVFSKVDASERQQRFEKALDELDEEWSSVFKKLAE